MPKLQIIFSIILIVLISCNTNSRKKEEVKSITESENRSKISYKEYQRIDSLRSDKILQNALAIAKGKDVFSKEYIVEINQEFDKSIGVTLDSYHDIKVEIESGYFFNEKHPHILIRQSGRGNVRINIFSKNDKLKQVISNIEFMTYINDTIQDINGDGYNDFVINGRVANGYCPPFSLIHLYHPKTSDFSEQFDFLNPTFSPHEKIIRGVEYGPPEDTGLYKYKWNGECVDTIEYVYYERDKNNNKTGMVIVSNEDQFSHGSSKKIKRLKAAPKEYHNIMGYDWFTGDVEEQENNLK